MLRIRPVPALFAAVVILGLYAARCACAEAEPAGTRARVAGEADLDQIGQPQDDEPVEPTGGQPGAVGLAGTAQGDATDVPRGCAVGAAVPAFYVRQVNCQQPNLARCLVCRNGHRPVVMICTRKLDDQVADLLEAIDRSVDSHRAQGLRAFAMFLDADGEQLQPQLATLARERELSIPLTLPVERAGPAALGLADEPQTIVVLYVQRKVVACHHYGAQELSAEAIARLVLEAEQMVEEQP